MKEFFENLREKREEKGVSLEEIHKNTYLPLNYLKAIESGEIEKLPKGYDRVFLKRYIAEIGLDIKEVMQDYDMLYGRLTPRRTYKIKIEKKLKGEPDAPPRILLEQKSNLPTLGDYLEKVNLDKINKYFWIILAAAILIIAGIFSYREYVHEKSSEINIKEIPSSNDFGPPILEGASVGSSEKQDNSQSKAESGRMANKESETFVIELKAKARTWVRQIIIGEDTTEYTLTVGFSHRVESDKPVKYLIGRADGVEVWFNGENLGRMGGADEVVLSLIISEKGIVEKRLKKVVRGSSAKKDSSVAELL